MYRDGTKRHTDYLNIRAATPDEAERIALTRTGVRFVKWVAEPDPERERS